MVNERVLYNNILERLSQKFIVAHDERALLLAQILKNELNADIDLIEAGLVFYSIVSNRKISLNNLQDLFAENVLIMVSDSLKIKDFLFNTYHEHLKKILELPVDNKFRNKALDNIKKFIFTLIRDFNSIFIINAYYLLLLREYPALPAQLKDRVRKHVEFIFSPIAHRLGFYRLKSAYDDLLFKYTLPEKYNEIKNYVEKIKKQKTFNYNTEFNLDKFKNDINRLLQQGLKTKYKYRIKGRIKSTASIYKKILKKGEDLESIKDIFALRIIFDVPYEIKDGLSAFPRYVPQDILEEEYRICWETYGLIRQHYEQIKFKNYISNPKPNGYQSLHITVLAPGNIPVEIQIRTSRMDQVAEKGDAAHWMYKEQGSNKINRDEVFRVLRELTEQEKSENINKNFNEIYVFTPEMHLINLPKGATVLDFAYAIHSRIGEKCTGARVADINNLNNHRVISYKEELQNGWVVRILTSSTQKPTDQWLEIVKTTHAKKKIKSYLKLQKLEPNISAAKEMLERKLLRWGYSLTHPIIPKLIKELGYSETYLFYNDIALGKIDLTRLKTVIQNIELKEQRTFVQTQKKILTSTEQSDKVLVAIFENNSAKILFVSRAKCCNPQPGDKIQVYLSPRSKTVHKATCPELGKIRQTNPERVFSAAWVKPHKKLDINELAREHTVLLLIVDSTKVESNEQIQQDLKKILSNFSQPLKRILVRQGRGKTLRVFIIIQGKADKKSKPSLISDIEALPYVLQIRERKYNPDIRTK